MNPAGIVLLVGIAALCLQYCRLILRWSDGKRAKVNWRRGLLGLPHAYLHVVHDVVARDPFAARMHALTAGGLLLALTLSVVRDTLGMGGPIVSALVLIALAFTLAGTFMVGWRRLPVRPKRLSGGAYSRIPLALLACILFLAGAAVGAELDLGNAYLPVWSVLVLLGIGGFGWLIRSAFGGPMRHVLAGVTHLVAHPRPNRLAGMLDTALRPIALDADVGVLLGTGKMADFAWNRLAEYDSCVQCGKCEAVCPAHAAGQKLNPKALINALVRASGPGVGVPYDGAPHPGRLHGVVGGDAPMPLLAEGGSDGFISPDTLWACTTCRACVHECPMLIEHVDAIIDIRRFATLEQGSVPSRVANELMTTRATDTPSGRALCERLDWAVDLALPLFSDRKAADVLLWLGDAAYERRNQKTLRSLVRLLRMADVDFAVLGDEELDCGDSARRVGDEVTFQHLATANITTLSRYRFVTILTADPHALHSLNKEYPAFGGCYRVQHHSTFLDGLFDEGRLRLAESANPAGKPRSVAFHDPCYLGRYSGEIAAPRRLLDRLGLDRVEMERSGFRSTCCGGGGGAPLSDIPGQRRIADMRMDHARETRADILAVACPNCMVMLEGVIEPRPEIMDLAELVLERVEAAR
jgi:Fe-S oxidoreductase